MCRGFESLTPHGLAAGQRASLARLRITFGAIRGPFHSGGRRRSGGMTGRVPCGAAAVLSLRSATGTPCGAPRRSEWRPAASSASYRQQLICAATTLGSSPMTLRPRQ